MVQFLNSLVMKTKMMDAKALADLEISCQHVLTDPLHCVAFASDASFYRQVPQAVARPRHLEEIKALFSWSHVYGIPLVFRAGGTSLSGQSITDGVLVDVSLYWRGFEILGEGADKGERIAAQPGVIGGHLNAQLQALGKKIGPDPASIQSCMVGGILANNASGMCCGVQDNAYHTLDSLVFMLPDGNTYDTALPTDRERFLSEQEALCLCLQNLRKILLEDPQLLGRIREKYRQKNTTGYSLNAFVDFDDPVGIFSHLLIGSEGTLAFIAEARLKTLSVLPFRSTGLLFFENVETACAALTALRPLCVAIELMDGNALGAVPSANLEQWWPSRERENRSKMGQACALLVECHAETADALVKKQHALEAIYAELPLTQAVQMTSDPVEQALLWKLRKGLYPSVGAVRQSGTAVIIEDVVFPPDRLAEGIHGLQRLFEVHGYTPAQNTGGIIFGHAMDANVHFVLTQSFSTPVDIARYDAFMQDLVGYVLGLDGALKAEHGTGRNIAPFVVAEWGDTALDVMQQLKQAVDPWGLLNPGVILSVDPQAHLRHLKNLPSIDAEVDRCTECGFCETVCPSRRVTLTPRQRIVLRRERERLKQSGQTVEMKALDQAYTYAGLETCATDSLCATACPIGIDTGSLVKRLRQASHSLLEHREAKWAATGFGVLEQGVRAALSLAHLGQSIGASKPMNFVLARVARHLNTPLPRWHKDLPPANTRPLPVSTSAAAEFVYFPSCLSRNLGYTRREPLPELVMALAKAAGLRLYLPAQVKSHCCGLPLGSKGFPLADEQLAERSVALLWEVSQHGHLPVIMDTSPCTHHLQERLQARGIEVLDFVAFGDRYLLPRLKLKPVYEHLYVHPVCSLQKMDLSPALLRIAEQCAHRVSAPLSPTCCGTAGDRGLLYPELPQAALADVQHQIDRDTPDMICASSRSCEMGISLTLEREVVSVAHILWKAYQETSE